MKTKLLKKIRKRYMITYYPKRFDIGDVTYFGECMVLWDNEDDHILGCGIGEIRKEFFTYFRSTKQQAKEILMEELVSWIKREYKHTRKRKSKQQVENIWYNNL